MTTYSVNIVWGTATSMAAKEDGSDKPLEDPGELDDVPDGVVELDDEHIDPPEVEPDPSPFFEPSVAGSSASVSVASGSVSAPGLGPPGGIPMPALVNAFVPGGEIRYYATTGNFVAYCCNKSHGKCELTRGAKKTSRAKGRPLALMMVFLSKHNHATKAAHWADWPSRADRNKARSDLVLAAATHSWAADLLKREFHEGDFFYVNEGRPLPLRPFTRHDDGR